MKIRFIAVFVIIIHSICYGQTTLTFKVDGVPLEGNQKVGIRGNITPLDWSKSIPLKDIDGAYTVDVEFESIEKEIEFKFVIFTDDKNPTWEVTPNRTFSLDKDRQNQISENKWNSEQTIDINSLQEIGSDELLKDFELIKTMVLNVHPGTYRYNSEMEIAKALNQLKDKFSKPLTYQEAYIAMSKLTAQIQCDHTMVGFNNQNKLINSIIHKQSDKVPFTFKWIHDEMIVTKDASKSNNLARGTKIHSINGIPVVDIRNQIMEHIGADGATDNNRIYKAEVNGYDFRYNAFDVFYPLIFPLENEKVKLVVQQPNTSITDTIHVSLVTREQRSKTLKERYEEFPKSRDDMWNLKFLSDSLAILSLNSFGLNGWKAMTIDYKAFLADAFKQLDKKRVHNLIIDIRENTGGSDEMANELFGYLSKEPYNFEREGRTRYLNFPESLKPFIKTWGDYPWYYNLTPQNKTPENGYYVFKDNFSQPIGQSDKKIYEGKIFLLTSSANTSLAFYTAYRFKSQQLGITIGQETGGNLNDINGGQILFLRLPNSKIEIDFPVMGGFTSTVQPNQGVVPDIAVEYKISDIIDARDVEIDEVLKLIDK